MGCSDFLCPVLNFYAPILIFYAKPTTIIYVLGGRLNEVENEDVVYSIVIGK